MDNKNQNNRIIYVEPNDVFEYNNTNESASLTPTYEDFCISFKLFVDIDSRFNRNKNKQKSFELSWSNVVRGKEINGENSEYLTTYYTDINFDNYGTREIVEGLGVENIQIRFESWYTPTISIKFVDVRGSGIFGNEEYKHSIGKGKSIDDIFECFFNIPYPRFRLQVKGFLGKPVTYQMTCSDFSANYNSNNGNFEIDTTFIGYTYSILADIPMNYLISSPYCSYVGAEYWAKKCNSKEWQLDDGTSPKKLYEFYWDIIESKRKDRENNIIVTKAQNDELDRLSEEIKVLNEIKNSINKIIKFYSDKYIIDNTDDNCKYFLMRNSIPSRNEIDSINKKVDELSILIDEYSKNYNSSNIIDKKIVNCLYLDSIKNETNKFKKFFSFEKVNGKDIISIENINSADLVGDGSKSTVDNVISQYNIETLMYYDALNNIEIGHYISKKINESIENHNKVNLREYATIIDLSEINSILNNKIAYNKEERNKIERSIQSKITSSIDEVIGFKPTIYNIFKIIMCHLETFVEIMKSADRSISDEILAGKRNCKTLNISMENTDVSNSDGTIPAWVGVYNRGTVADSGNVDDISNVIGWVGDYSHNFIEEKVVNGFQHGIQKIDKEIKLEPYEYIDSSKPYMLCAFDYINGLVNPFSFITNKNIELSDLSYYLIVRYIQLHINNKGFDNNVIDNMGEYDAENLIKELGSMNVIKNNIMSECTTSTDFINKILGIAQLKDDYNGYKTNSNGDNNYYNFEIFNSDKKNNILYKDSNTQYKYEYGCNNNDNDNNNPLIPWKLNGFNINDSHYISDDVSDNIIVGHNLKEINNIENNINIVNKVKIQDTNSIFGYDYNVLKSNIDNNAYVFNLLYIHDIYNLKEIYERIKKSNEAYIDYVKYLLCVNIFTSIHFTMKGRDENADLCYKCLLFLSSYCTGYDFTFPKIYQNDLTKYRLIDALLIGGYLYRMKYMHENGYDFVDYNQYKNIYGIDINYPKTMYDTFITYDNNEKFYFVGNIKSDNRFNYIKLDKYVYEYENNQELIDLFINFATRNEFPSILSHLKIYGLNKNSYNIDPETEVSNNMKEYDFNDLYNIAPCVLFESRGINKLTFGDSFSDKFILIKEKDFFPKISIYFKKDSDIQEILMKLLNERVLISNIKYIKYFKEKNKINTINIQYYLTSFYNKLVASYQEYEDKHKIKDNESNKSDETLIIDKNISLNVYMHLKNIWDKWLCSSEEDEFKVENYFEKNFVFMDTFYRKMGNILPINCEKLLDFYIGRKKDVSLLIYLSDIITEHQCIFFSIPDFIGFNNNFDDDNETMKDLFKPLPYNKIGKAELDNKFLVIFTNYPSKVLSHRSDFRYDGFDIWNPEELTDAAPDVFKAEKYDNGGEIKSYNVPSFGVTVNKQNNHIFKNIKVDMKNPISTEAGMIAWDKIIEKGHGAERTLSFHGQDMYKIFSSYSYFCDVEMIGNAQISPLMYFQLMNLPMWRGTYMIFNVTHNMTPGNMTTNFKGMKLSSYRIPYSSTYFSDKPELTNYTDYTIDKEYNYNQKKMITDNISYVESGNYNNTEYYNGNNRKPSINLLSFKANVVSQKLINLYNKMYEEIEILNKDKNDSEKWNICLNSVYRDNSKSDHGIGCAMDLSIMRNKKDGVYTEKSSYGYKSNQHELLIVMDLLYSLHKTEIRQVILEYGNENEVHNNNFVFNTLHVAVFDEVKSKNAGRSRKHDFYLSASPNGSVLYFREDTLNNIISDFHAIAGKAFSNNELNYYFRNYYQINYTDEEYRKFFSQHINIKSE